MELHRPMGEVRSMVSLDDLLLGIKSAIAWARPDQLSFYYAQSLEIAAKDIRIKLENSNKKDL